jgi:phosphoglycolate phosphatase-like HAD superfamily hydrolase
MPRARPTDRGGGGATRRGRRRGGVAVAATGGPVDLTGIDAVIFDKDGTLIDFHAMWGGWARQLGERLDATIRRPVSLDVFATIGFDPTTGRVAPGGPLATSTMAGIEETVARVLRRWCPSIAAARRATEAAWFVPDPATSAVPLADLRTIFDRLRTSGRRIAIVTTDDRAPTDAALRALGIRERVEAIVCGDDGFDVKPAPDAVFAVCHAFRIEPARVAVVGDTPTDLAMARTAGAGRVVGVRSGLGSDADLASADAIIESIGDLLTS